MIKFCISNQLIAMTSMTKVVSGSVDFVDCYFEFSQDWLGYAKTAVFKQADQNYGVPILDDHCYLPHTLTAGTVRIGVVGMKAGQPNKATTTSESFEVLATISGDTIVVPPLPSGTEYVKTVPGYITELKEENGTPYYYSAGDGIYKPFSASGSGGYDGTYHYMYDNTFGIPTGSKLMYNVTALRLTKTPANTAGNNSQILGLWGVGTKIGIQELDNPANYVKGTIASTPIDNESYFEFAWNVTESAGTIPERKVGIAFSTANTSGAMLPPPQGSDFINKRYLAKGNSTEWEEYNPPKDFGDTTETWTGKYDRTDNNNKIYCKWFYYGAMPNNTTTPKAHGILNFKNSRPSIGLMFAGSGWFNLPHVEPVSANNIGLWTNATNVLIVTGTNRSTFTAWVYLEYTCTDR